MSGGVATRGHTLDEIRAWTICAEQVPELVDRDGGHPSACHFAEPDVSVTLPSP